MRRTGNFQFGFPRFTGALRNLVLLSAAIYVVTLLLFAFTREVAINVFLIGGLSPVAVRHGWIWQLLTYGFLDNDPLRFLLTMLTIYFLGSSVQERIGSRAFAELYLSSIVGAAILGTIVAWTGQIGLGAAVGAGAAANGILMVFYLLFREAPIMLFPLPIPIPVKWIVIFTAAVEGAYLLLSHFALYFLILLLGLVSGYLWYRFLWRRAAMTAAIGESIHGMRNSYYRWKRRRAARKFQVYMRKHQHDPKQYFDEYGNFRPPDDDEKKDRGGWVN